MSRPDLLPTFEVTPIDREMHPEDIANQTQAEREAIEYGPAILDRPDVTAYLTRLMLVYSDADASKALANLREWFWAFPIEKQRKSRRRKAARR